MKLHTSHPNEVSLRLPSLFLVRQLRFIYHLVYFRFFEQNDFLRIQNCQGDALGDALGDAWRPWLRALGVGEERFLMELFQILLPTFGAFGLKTNSASLIHEDELFRVGLTVPYSLERFDPTCIATPRRKI